MATPSQASASTTAAAAVAQAQQQQQQASLNTAVSLATKSRALTTKVQVHMSVVLSILDQHMRRNAASVSRNERVIGTLLGVQLGGGLIEITGSYPVPHVEKDKEVAVGKDFNRQMKALHAKSNPGEQVVGKFLKIFGSETILILQTDKFLLIISQGGMPLQHRLRRPLMQRVV
jgi:hypothetical protein